MLLFHGGLTIEQVEKLKSGERIIYDKMTEFQATRKITMGKNSFDFLLENDQNLPEKEKIKRIIEKNYLEQNIFFFKYLRNSLSFCVNIYKKNWILVIDVPAEILSKTIGIGKYPHEGYKLEYVIPLTSDFDFSWIKDFQYYEPCLVTEDMKQKYGMQFYSARESDIALKVLKKTNKECKFI